jgi:hypothetical protein
MALTTVLSVQVLPSAITRYSAAIQRLAEAARKKKEGFTWRAFQTLYGGEPTIRFVSAAESFEALGKRGTIPELVARVLGAGEAPRFVDEVGACIRAQELTVSVDRPDLSYAPRPLPPSEVNAALVARIVIQPGLRESFEELLRKVAEAIPKLDEPVILLTQQTLVGNAAEYRAIRPLRELSEIDQHRTPEQLLLQAFGPGEGGLIFRNGSAAILDIRREVVGLRPELSNPPD